VDRSRLKDREANFVYLSFGAGVQSTALLIMSVLGLDGCPKADAAIFADTQDEPLWVYENVERMARWCGERIPVRTITYGHLSGDLKVRNFPPIPAYTRGENGTRGMLRQQCTREYKIDPISAFVKRLLGYKKGQWVRHKVLALIGISLDEAHRMGTSRDSWITNCYPLIDARLTRNDCLRIIDEAGLPLPKKSACVHCPYHSDEYWRGLKEHHPSEFAKAVETDQTIRNMTRKGASAPIFLHRSLQPLKEVKFDKKQYDLDFEFGNDCSGVCGV